MSVHTPCPGYNQVSAYTQFYSPFITAIRITSSQSESDARHSPFDQNGNCNVIPYFFGETHEDSVDHSPLVPGFG